MTAQRHAKKRQAPDRLSWYAYFPADFEEGTADFTLAEVGAYQRLLNAQWAKKGIPGDNLGALSRILRCTPAVAKSVWGKVTDKFTRCSDGLWRNKRLAHERELAEAAQQKARDNGAKGAEKRWQKDSEPISPPNGNPMHPAIANASPPLWQNDSSPDPHNDHSKERSDRPPVRPPASNMAPLRGRFDAFWAEYPKKRAKGAAWKAWQKLKPSSELTSQMLTALRRQRSSSDWRDSKFIPHPATWLNDERWSDEPSIQLERESGPIPFWDECATCGDVHPVDQPCPSRTAKP